MKGRRPAWPPRVYVLLVTNCNGHAVVLDASAYRSGILKRRRSLARGMRSVTFTVHAATLGRALPK